MNRTRLLMIGVLALGLGLVASMYVYKGLQARSGAGNDPGGAIADGRRVDQ